jgi:twinkle protein
MNMKDASDLLQAAKRDPSYLKKITSAVYEARAWRPGGIVEGKDLWDAMMAAAIPGRETCFTFLNGTEKGIGGAYPGRLIMWVSGSGMGKSTAVREVAYYDLMHHGMPVADVRLEENVGKTGLGYVGLHLNRRLMLGGFDKSDPAIRRAFEETVANGRFWTFDHFGSLDGGDLVSKLRYLAVGCGAKTIILDHISIVVSDMSAQADGKAADERTTIDRLMTQLRALVENTGITLHAVCHLKRVSGGEKSHEEGGRVTLADLRGSQSIAQLSDAVIAMERNQQDEDDIEVTTVDGELRSISKRDVARWRSLKSRDTGFTGVMGHTFYDRRTGRMVECVLPDQPKEEKNAPRRSTAAGARADDDPPF